MPCVSLQRKNTRLQEENVSLDHFYNLSGVPTEEYTYNFNCFETDGIPIHVRTRRREIHRDAASRWQESVEYTDGLGRLALSKVQAEPGLYKTIEDGVVVEKDSGSVLRWVGTGRTIYNNAGNPIKQYEPYFSGTDAYESEPEIVETGVTPILHYDPLDRLIRTDFPDGSYSQVEFSAWDQKSFDQNDTVLDSDWYADRGSPDPIGNEPNNPETRAAWLAAKHASTATVMYLDALGRAFYSIADNGVQGSYATHTELDILGNPLSVTDARDHVVMSTVYNALSVPCKTESMDAGERKTLQAVDGLPVLGFDSRSHRLCNEYDALRRPTNQWLSENSSTEILIGKTIYGESATSPETHHLRGKLWKSYDQSGLVVNTSYDFKGNLLESTRQFTQVYNATIDWNIAEPDTLLESETFTTITAYDALNRAISIKTPHNANIPASEVLPSYNEASLLEKVDVKIRGSILVTNFVGNIDYNAKGQRERIQYGNASTTGYTYDEKTFRLKRLLTTRNNGADTLQDLNYTYDPVGNITQIDDNAQQTIYFNGSVVSPSQKFEYDALYRLTKATGREHVSINASSEPEAEGYNQAQISPQDGSAMRNYVREWQYDSVGNILSLIHNANGNAWTRSYDYASDNNRLSSTTVGQSTVNYTYNAHGSMTSMPHLQSMQWDFAEKLSHITRGTTEAYYNYDGGGIRTRKVVEKNGVTETRLYLGGFEIWRKRINGVLDTERETLHVMDDSTRVAVVETLTVDNSSAVANPVPVQRYQLDNHLGSASLELDDLANVISYEEYYPYGDTSYRAGRNIAETGLKRYRYIGKEKDEESSLYYCEQRYSATHIMRWLSTDPLGLIDGINLYAYVNGNPVSGVDPSGTQTEEKVDEGKVFPTFEEVEIKGEGGSTYLSGDETDQLTKNSTFEERQAFANRQGYQIIDPNPEDEWWYDDGDHCQWMLSEQGKLILLQEETRDSNNVLLKNKENISDSQKNTGIDYDTYVKVSSGAMQVGLATGEKVYGNVVENINKLETIALDNPRLNQETTKNVQQAFVEHSNAAKATARFMNRANIFLSVGLGVIEAGEYAYQGKMWHSVFSAIMTMGSVIIGGAVLSSTALSLSAVILASVGLVAVFSFVQIAVETFFDYMEIK